VTVGRANSTECRAIAPNDQLCAPHWEECKPPDWSEAHHAHRSVFRRQSMIDKHTYCGEACIGVCIENLRPDVVVMESAKDRV
jgi:hypothetical protein